MVDKSAPISAWVVGDAEVIQKFERMNANTHKEVVKTVGRLAIMVQGYVKGSKLSGQVLRNRTGTLRRSITQRVYEQPQDIRAKVGTNVAYARPHEFGWAGQRLVTQAFGRPLKFPVWSNVTLPQRSFLRSSLKDKASTIRTDLSQAVLRGTKA